jgi:hypothetical protein
MENTELMALAVLVESYTMAGVAANVYREHRGEVLAYQEHPRPDLVEKLEAELKRRGTI